MRKLFLSISCLLVTVTLFGLNVKSHNRIPSPLNTNKIIIPYIKIDTPLVAYDSDVVKHLREADSLFLFNGKPINPYIIAEFSPRVADGAIVMSMDLEMGNHSNKYFEDVNLMFHSGKYENEDLVHPDKKEIGFYYGNDRSEGSFSYNYIGKTKSDTHVVEISDNGGGTFTLRCFLFFRFSIRTGFIDDDRKSDQLLMTLVGNYCPAANRWQSVTPVLKKDKLIIDISAGGPDENQISPAEHIEIPL